MAVFFKYFELASEGELNCFTTLNEFIGDVHDSWMMIGMRAIYGGIVVVVTNSEQGGAKFRKLLSLPPGKTRLTTFEIVRGQALSPPPPKL